MCNIEGTQIRKVHLVVEHNLVVGEGVGGGGVGWGGVEGAQLDKRDGAQFGERCAH
jgi:hypothetical protein